MSTLSFHFHGYQPGDIVGWPEPDPLRPQRIEERHSPVVLRIGPDRIEGRNWTDAVLRTYGRMGSVLHRASGSASVDIEPQTLVWLLERDPSAYRAIIDRKSTRLNSSHSQISYAVFCLTKKKPQ